MTTDNTQESKPEYKSGSKLRDAQAELRDEMLQGSEVRHYGNRHTPDGAERVEMVPLEWAIEVATAHTNNRINEVLDRLKEPTMLDVFPSKPYDGSNTHKDMVSVIKYYKDLIEQERKRLKEGL